MTLTRADLLAITRRGKTVATDRDILTGRPLRNKDVATGAFSVRHDHPAAAKGSRAEAIADAITWNA